MVSVRSLSSRGIYLRSPGLKFDTAFKEESAVNDAVPGVGFNGICVASLFAVLCAVLHVFSCWVLNVIQCNPGFTVIQYS